MLTLEPTTQAPTAGLRAVLAGAPDPAGGARRPAPRRDLFNDIVAEAISTGFDAGTARSIRYLNKTFSLGFTAAKAGELSAAEVEFARAEALLAQYRASFSAAALALIECWARPYRAYYEYRRQRFAAAAEQTQLAIASIWTLEAQIPVLHMARVQQLHNLTRVSFRQGDAEAGTALVRALLLYLSAGTPPALPGSWAPALLAGTPPTLRADMFQQIFLEMAGLLLQQPDHAQRRYLFTSAFGQLTRLAPPVAFWPPYQAWLTAYEAVLFGEAEQYAPALAAYLTPEASPAPETSHALDSLTLGLLVELRRAVLATDPALAAQLLPYARRRLWLTEQQLALLA